MKNLNTRAKKQAAWDLYNAVYGGKFAPPVADASGRLLLAESRQARALKDTYFDPRIYYGEITFTSHGAPVIRRRALVNEIPNLITDAKARDADCYDVTLITSGEIPVLDLPTSCIYYEQNGRCYVEDDKYRPVHRCPYVIYVHGIGPSGNDRQEMLIVTKDRVTRRPYLTKNYEELLGMFADRDIPATDFNRCYKVGLKTVSHVVVSRLCRDAEGIAEGWSTVTRISPRLNSTYG